MGISITKLFHSRQRKGQTLSKCLDPRD